MIFFTPLKIKTTKYKKLIFAGVLDYVTSIILYKFESPILINSEVMGVKNHTNNGKHTHRLTLEIASCKAICKTVINTTLKL